jgi:hypothetical protein
LTCPNCGTNNLDTASICANCGRPLSAPSAPPPPPLPPPQSASYTPPPPRVTPMAGPGLMPGEKIPNYLFLSIFVTLCCCLPLGIVGIIFGAQVNTKLAQGDLAGAREASRKAKMFSLIGIAVWVVLLVISFALNGPGLIDAIRDASQNR